MSAALLVVSAGFVPSAASVPSAPTMTIAPDPITPSISEGCSSAYNPCYTASGTADPGAEVTVTVTDDVNPELAISATTYAKRFSDPGDPTPSGQAGYWVVSPRVTDLGTHDKEPSTLTFTAHAALDGVQSAPVNQTVTKMAFTPGDAVPPLITAQEWPPADWCHTGIGATCSNRNCFVDTLREMTRGQPVSVANEETRRNQCSGYGRIVGRVEDDHEGAAGVASEIADVTITISSTETGETREIRSFIRVGTRALYFATISIADFEVGEYEIRVSARDAAGLAAEDAVSAFVVYPT